jgi:hypothetical protein
MIVSIASRVQEPYCGVDFLDRAQVARCSRGESSHCGRFAVADYSAPGYPLSWRRLEAGPFRLL